jgi:hypothetical protein
MKDAKSVTLAPLPGTAQQKENQNVNGHTAHAPGEAWREEDLFTQLKAHLMKTKEFIRFIFSPFFPSAFLFMELKNQLLLTFSQEFNKLF